MHEKPTLLLVVAAALIAEDGRVCLQQRPAGKQHGGLWEFPGGKVEPGESPEAALVRELAEELGVEIAAEALRPCGFAASGRIAILLYACRDWRGVAEALEGGAVDWFVPDRLSRQAMPPLDYPLAEQVEKLLAKGVI